MIHLGIVNKRKIVDFIIHPIQFLEISRPPLRKCAMQALLLIKWDTIQGCDLTNNSSGIS
jgi:hypothetical protein